MIPADPCMTFDPRNVLRSVQGYLLPYLVAIGNSWAIWPVVEPSWPLHDIWPHQCTTLRSGVLPTKLGCHRVFLSNLIPIDPTWPLHDLWPHHCTTLWPLYDLRPKEYIIFRSEVLPIKFGSQRAFLKQFDFQMTFDLWSRHLEKLTTNLGGLFPTTYQVSARCVEALWNA